MDAGELSAQIAALWARGAPDRTIVLKPSRTDRYLIVALGAAIVAAVVFLPGNPLVRWLLGVVFGLLMLGGLVAMLSGSGGLELRRDGFTTVQMFRRKTTLWTQTAGFRAGPLQGFWIWGVELRPKFVLVDLAGPSAQQAGARVAAVVSGAHNALPETYGLEAEHLASLMNEMREHALSRRR